MRQRALFALPFAVLLVAAAVPSSPLTSDEIRLVPREGLVLRKSFELSSESSHENLSPDEGGSTQSFESEAALVVLDVTKAADDERVLELERTYEEVTSTHEGEFEHAGGSSSHENEADCDLEDETVVFEWDEDEEEYVTSSDGADDEAIQHLPQDLDYTAFLPGGDVDEGDDWEIEIEDFEAATDPLRGIQLDWGLDDDAEGREVAEVDPPTIESSTDGEITATYEGTREVDGREVAVITIEGEIEVETTIDSVQEYNQGYTNEMHEESVSTRTVEGELLWDLAGGHLLSLEIEIEMESSGTSSNVFRFGDQEFASEGENESEGTTVLTATFERVEEEE